jgi:hypothetical protein
MPKSIRIPSGNGFQDFTPGPFSIEIDTQTRSDSAVVTVTRTSAFWPTGPLFTYVISERNRGSNELHRLTSGTESGTGGPVLDRQGNPTNPPFRITLRWAVDKDKDVLRFEGEVLQTFNSSITVEFI